VHSPNANDLDKTEVYKEFVELLSRPTPEAKNAIENAKAVPQRLSACLDFPGLADASIGFNGRNSMTQAPAAALAGDVRIPDNRSFTRGCFFSLGWLLHP
jgi:hypothetical protein